MVVYFFGVGQYDLPLGKNSKERTKKDWQVGRHKAVRYRFTIDEMKRLNSFLVEVVKYLSKIADEALQLKGTSDTASPNYLLIIFFVSYIF